MIRTLFVFSCFSFASSVAYEPQETTCDSIDARDLTPRRFWEQIESRQPLLIRGGGRQPHFFQPEHEGSRDFLARFGNVSVQVSTIPSATSFEGLERDWPGAESFWRLWLGRDWADRPMPRTVYSRRIDRYEPCLPGSPLGKASTSSGGVVTAEFCSITGCFETEGCALFHLDVTVVRPALHESTIASLFREREVEMEHAQPGGLDAKARERNGPNVVEYVQYLDVPGALKPYITVPAFASLLSSIEDNLEFCGLWLSSGRDACGAGENRTAPTSIVRLCI